MPVPKRFRKFRNLRVAVLAVVVMSGTAILSAAESKGTAPAASTNAAPARRPQRLEDLFPDVVVAKGKGVEVKRSVLDDSVTSLKSSAAARGEAMPPEQIPLIERQVLERLIQIQLLLAKATDEDRAKGRTNSDKLYETVKSRAGTDQNLSRQLKSVGMEQADFKNKMMDEAIAQAVLDRELNIVITDAQVRKYYDDNPARFELPEMVRASHILLTTRDSAGAELTEAQKSAKRKQLEGILKRARDGEDFTKLAKEYSEDPSVKENSGEYTFPRASADPRHAMVPEFETAAFSMATNQVSDIVTTQYGYHIIKLNEKIPAHKVDFAKVAPDIRDFLKLQETQKLLPALSDKLKKDAGVEILDPRLKSVPLVTDKSAS